MQHIYKNNETISQKWRSAGIKIVLYLDDGICTNANYEQLLGQAAIIKDDLNKAGFIYYQRG